MVHEDELDTFIWTLGSGDDEHDLEGAFGWELAGRRSSKGIGGAGIAS